MLQEHLDRIAPRTMILALFLWKLCGSWANSCAKLCLMSLFCWIRTSLPSSPHKKNLSSTMPFHRAVSHYARPGKSSSGWNPESVLRKEGQPVVWLLWELWSAEYAVTCWDISPGSAGVGSCLTPFCVAVSCFLHMDHYFGCWEGRQSCSSSWFPSLCFLPGQLVAWFSIRCLLWVVGVEKGTWEECCSCLLSSSGQLYQQCIWGKCGKRQKKLQLGGIWKWNPFNIA